ncbi:tail fiber domain-containing protein [Bdellovibrio sp. HCB-162]|uniref:tail fiber domain-containing protein n=1 Tax=Bdellovibrio sp. HCB-162 TaxID=3394234 RepID=UPI0039BC2F0A
MKLILSLVMMIFVSQAHAVATSPGSLFTYEGVLTDSSGTPITTPQTVTFQVIYGTSCIAYEETQPISPGSQGEFSVIVGAGTRTDTTTNNATRIFASSGSLECSGASSVTVSGFATRSLHIKVGSTDLTPDVVIGNIPFAINSQKLADKGPSDFVQTSGIVTQAAIENLLSGGTVTGVTASAPLVSSGGATPNISIAPANTSTNGYLSSADWNIFNNKLGTSTLFGGDVTGPYNNVSVDKIKGTVISATNPTINQVLQFDGSQWVPATLPAGNSGTITGVTAGTGLTGGGTSGSVTLNVNVGTGANQIVQMNGAGKLPAVDGSQLTNVNAVTATTASGISATAVINTSGNISTTGTLSAPTITNTNIFTDNIYVRSPAAGGNQIQITGPSTPISANYVLRLPSALPTTGTQVLASDTAGNMSWVTQAAGGSYITALTGDVTASGPNSAAATITTGAVTTTKILDGTILVADLNNTGVNDGTAAIVVKDGTGKFSNFSCGTAGNVATWTLAGWVCQAPSPLLPVLASGKIWIGDGTNVAVAQTMSGAATISTTGVVTLANMPANTLKGNNTATAATPTDITISSLQGTTATTFAAGNDSRITGALQNSGGAMTGMLTLAPGTTSLSPMRIPAGTLVGTAVSGNIESDGANLYWTNNSPSRQKLASYIGTAANGQLLIGNGSGFTLANITGGSGITVTNSAGGITIAASGGGGGTVTNVSSANGDISVTSPTTAPVLTLNSTVTGGSASFAGKIPKLDSTGLIDSTLIPSFDAGKIVSGTLPITRGGTGATTAAAAQTNLGLGTAATKNTGSVSGSVPLIGVSGITNNSMCTSDGTGSVICNTAIPVSSQWATSGANISYTGGNVGIGTNSPAVPLDVLSTTPVGLSVKSASTSFSGMNIVDSAGTAVYSLRTYGTGSVSPAPGSFAIVNGPNPRLVIDPAGNLGLGTNTPGQPLSIWNEYNGTSSFGANIDLRTYGGASLIYGAGSGGTRAAPNPLVANNTLLILSGDGYDGTNWPSGKATISFKAAGTWGGSSTPTYMTFNTTPIGSLATAERMRIDSNGNVGIGITSPGYTLHVNGPAAGTSAWQTTSDRRYKKNIEVLPGALAKILQLRGVSFQWRQEDFPSMKFMDGNDIGVIAQEVEAVYPEAVTTGTNGYKTVGYSKLVAPLIESTKELYGMCKANEEQVKMLERKIASLEEADSKKENRIRTLESENEELKKDLKMIKEKLGLQ